MYDDALDKQSMDSSEYKSTINKLCFSNIFVEGKKLLNESHIKKRRLEKHLRMKRHEKFLESVYTGLINRKIDIVSSDDLNSAETPPFRKSYYENSRPKYDELITDAMEKVWSRKPRDFQAIVTKHILKMGKEDNKVAPTLLVRGTGGGKSLVMQTIGVVKGGITLIIENTLSLSSDQMSKIQQVSKDYGNVIPLHLDAIKIDAEKKSTKQFLLGLGANHNITVFIFSSPEKLLDNFWLSIMRNLISSGLLKLCCVDEVHQFVTYGCFFRYKFEHLRKSFFKYLINEDESNNTVIDEQESNLASLATFTKIPLLFMTATFSTEMKQTLERIIGIKILTDNTFWGNVKDMTRRNISIEVSSHPQYLNSFKSEVKKAFADGSNKKAIVYLNTAYEAKKFKEKIDM